MSEQQVENTGDLTITGDEFRAGIAAMASFKLGRKVQVSEIEGLGLTDTADDSCFGFVADEAKNYEIEIIMAEGNKESEPAEAAEVVAEIGPEDTAQPAVLEANRQLPAVAGAGLEAGQYDGLASVPETVEEATLEAIGTPPAECVRETTPASEEPVFFHRYQEGEELQKPIEEETPTSTPVVVDDQPMAEVEIEDDQGALATEAGPLAPQLRQLAESMGSEPSEFEKHVRTQETPLPAEGTMIKRAGDMRALLARLQKK